ncbi:hypothetical protein SAMN04324258_0507 [Krasilnikoviella flava]|uniref:Uncharacterized protein n=1 Tax=Krasilnikoviella flava TaxID=526729 RepID=A0A1T5IGT4_9MICO|nr:hypothetical protein SAMN04324258_0507 [Krasilnikoviella flava]
MLALFVLWLGFWVPHRLRHRQQLLDSRVDDRFSGGLRVLAVAADAGGARGVTTPVGGGLPLLVPGTSPEGGRGERPMGLDDDRGVSRALTAPHAAVGDRPRESRLALLEQRAARARRRLLLTVLVLLLTVGAWVVVGLGLVSWYAAAAPTALLLVVLVLGRVAVVQARRADARWTAERKAARQQATQARALANGGPHAPRNRARVTGHAVRPSTTHTQMIPRVTAQGVDQQPPARPAARASRRPEPAPTARVSVPVDGARGGESAEPEPADVHRASSERVVFDVRADEPAALPDPVVVVDPGAGVPAGPPPVGSEPWEPVPVPLPTYVTKPAAPRREPRPLPASGTGRTLSAGDTARGAALASTMRAALGPTVTPAGVTGADRAPGTVGGASSAVDLTAADEPRPRTETLGLPLDEILARRRAAG